MVNTTIVNKISAAIGMKEPNEIIYEIKIHFLLEISHSPSSS